LTIAAARPRDEKLALDRILTSAQRPGVAEEAEYEYSRGGTPITGPTIKLLELVAQHWGNLEFGFRELARYPGANGLPGESVVEAFAWDLQTNTRRKVSFNVQHAMKSGQKMKTLTDPRDVYEHLANHAQRRVRTCLENIIPRDIVDTALEQCRQTLKTNEAVTPEKISKMLAAFAELGTTKEAVEARIQRRADTLTPAQMVQLRRIYASIKDGMSKPEDWFPISKPEETQPVSVADKAKAALRKKPAVSVQSDPHAAAGDFAQREATAGPSGTTPPVGQTVDTSESQEEPPEVAQARMEEELVGYYASMIDQSQSVSGVGDIYTEATTDAKIVGHPARARILSALAKRVQTRREALGAPRRGRPPKNTEQTAFA
jgi:hypothetical protein